MSKTKKETNPINKKREKVKYECKLCDYNTSKKTDFVRHTETRKHIKRKSRGNAFPKTLEKNENGVFLNKLICKCGRNFKTRSGLWKHKKICKYHNLISKETTVPRRFPKTKSVSTSGRDLSGVSLDDRLKLIQIENAQLKNKKLKKEIEILDKPTFSKSPNPSTNTLTNEAVKTIGEIAGDNNCNNTNNISINMYLNENCKNALNLEDFVKQITVSLQDLDYSKENGYAKGVTNILVKQLNDLSPTERPIHCSDKKRMKFYVKDDNKWAKDDNNVKLTNSIKSVGMEQVRTLTEWENLHPNYQEDPRLLTEWQTTLSKLTPGQDTKESQKNYTKIKKELCKVVDIKPELTK